MAIPELKDTADRLTDCIYFGDPLSASVGSGFVPTNRTLSTTLPLTGGGDLSANRTFAINNFAGSVAGAVPPSTGGVVTFLRADGAWATPPTFGAAAAGYAPASGGGAVNFLRADGSWAAPAGAVIAGLTPGRLPVATAADAIGNSRVTQSGTTFEFRTTETDPVNDYHGFYITETVGGAIQLIPYFYAPPTVFAAALVLRGMGSTGFFEAASTSHLRLNGYVCFPEDSITLANGLNSDIALPTAVTSSWIRSVGPTLPFSVGGFADPQNGQIVVLYNTTQQSMTIVNEDPSSGVWNRILTLTNANVVLPASTSSATFIYSNADLHWVLVSTNPASQYPRTLGYIPYQNSGGNLADSTLFFDSANARYGFLTATPKATVDINGTLATRSYNQVLSNGLNSDLPAPTTSYMRVSGPTGAFSIGGVIVPAGANGTRLTIRNTIAQAMTIVMEDASSTAAYRITTPTGANITTVASYGRVDMVYDAVTTRWVVTNVEPPAPAGSTSYVQYNSAGAFGGDSGLTVSGTGASKVLTLGTDVPLSRKATGHLELGIPGPTATAKKITGQSSIGGTDSNKRGGDLSVGGGAGTGSKSGGDTVLITSYPGSSGNTQNSFASRMVYAAKPVALTDTTDVLVATVGVPTETGSGGTLWYTIYATDGTDMQIRRGRVGWGAVNKAGTITVVLGTPEEVDCTPVGTLTVTVTAVDDTANGVAFKLNAITSLVATVTTFEAWVSLEHDGKGAITTV